MTRSITELFERYTDAQAGRDEILNALRHDPLRRRKAVLAYLDGQAPVEIAKRLRFGRSALFSLLQSSMRACYQRIYGEALPGLSPDRPSRQALRTGYRTDADAHREARLKVPEHKRVAIARAGGEAKRAARA